VIVAGGDESFVVDLWLLVGGCAGKGVFGGFYLVDVPVVFLFFGAYLLVVLFELLGGGEPGQQGEIRSHLNVTYLIITTKLFCSNIRYDN
jgi:hypothetical protein